MRFAIVFAFSMAASQLLAADAWPQYGGPTGDFRAIAAKATDASVEWKRAFGPGTSGVVSDGTRYHTMYAVPKEGGKACDEVTIALDPQTGTTIWEQSVPVKLLAKQESFGGSPMQPQATPAIFGGTIFTVGFTGRLHARDAASGQSIWSVDLVADYAATPVQYGFAASPIVRDGRLLVAVGGKHATIAFDPKNGKVIWKSAAAEPAYATPVVAVWDNRSMVVQLTRDALFGFDPANGTTLWTYPLPKKGLTNVPTPISLSEGRLIVSGQGIEGTRMLQLVKVGDSIEAKEIWYQRRAQFFYTNWACDGEAVYGFPNNAGKRLMALRVADGVVISQDVGQTDANVLLVGKKLLLCRGDGLLSIGSATADGFAVEARGRFTMARCWNPPTVIGDTILVRTNSEMAAVKRSSLTADFKPPADSGVTALEAAYGSPRPK